MFYNAVYNLVIGAAYYAMPVALLMSAKARSSVADLGWRDPMIKVLVLFGAFILSCGTGHFVDAWYDYAGECAALTTMKQVCNASTALWSVLTCVVIAPNLRSYLHAISRVIDMARLEDRIARLEDRK